MQALRRMPHPVTQGARGLGQAWRVHHREKGQLKVQRWERGIPGMGRAGWHLRVQ